MIAKMFKPRTGPRTSKQYTVWWNFWLSLIPQIAAQGLIAPGLMVSLIPYSYVAVISPVRAALKTRLSVSLPSPPRLIFHSLTRLIPFSYTCPFYLHLTENCYLKFDEWINEIFFFLFKSS